MPLQRYQLAKSIAHQYVADLLEDDSGLVEQLAGEPLTKEERQIAASELRKIADQHRRDT